MTRLEKAYEMYPDGIVIPKGNGLIRDVRIENCCPYFLDCGEDNSDEDTRIGMYGSIRGCRGITCEQCWNKLYEVIL